MALSMLASTGWWLSVALLLLPPSGYFIVVLTEANEKHKK